MIYDRRGLTIRRNNSIVLDNYVEEPPHPTSKKKKIQKSLVCVVCDRQKHNFTITVSLNRNSTVTLQLGSIKDSGVIHSLYLSSVASALCRDMVWQSSEMGRPLYSKMYRLDVLVWLGFEEK